MSKENMQLFPHGSIIELFRLFESSIFLMIYNEGQNENLLMKSGWFTVNLVIKAACPILATVCSVGDFQWPLTKDTVVIRIAKRTFVIAIPGLLYNLQFPNLCPEGDVDSLGMLFMRFCHYKDINDDDQGYPFEDYEPNLWDMLRPQIEPMVHGALVKLGHLPGPSRFLVSNYNSCFLRSYRMSATTKLIIDSMVHSGTLESMHVTITGTNPPDVLHNHDLTFASVNVFTCIVDAIEFSWVRFFGLDHLVKDVEPPSRASSHDIGFKAWSLNEDGHMDFMHRLVPLVENDQVNNDREFMGRRSQRQRKTNSKFKDFVCELPQSNIAGTGDGEGV